MLKKKEPPKLKSKPADALPGAANDSGNASREASKNRFMCAFRGDALDVIAGCAREPR
jgi:hypothetical protein